MSFFSSWSKLVTFGPRLARRLGFRRSSPKPRRRLYLEPLESRIVPSAILTTDKTAYAPTDPAVFTGSGFQAGETVDLSVVRSDGTNYAPWTVADDANGNFQTNWTIPSDAPGYTFTVTATGEAAGDSTTATFTGLTTYVYALPTDYAPGQTANLNAGGFT